MDPLQSNVNDELVEKMAKRTVLCQDSFNNSAKAIRGKDKQEVANAYHKAQQNGGMLPLGGPQRTLSDSELESLEQSLQVPAYTVEDHVLISLTAHSLLLSHLHKIGTLDPELANRINARAADLRSQLEPVNNTAEAFSRPFVPRPSPPLPELTRPIPGSLSPIDRDSVPQMLASPTTLVGKVFFLQDADLYYRIVGFSISMNEPTVFHLQYEDVSSADDVDETEMRNMLENSAVVSPV